MSADAVTGLSSLAADATVSGDLSSCGAVSWAVLVSVSDRELSFSDESFSSLSDEDAVLQVVPVLADVSEDRLVTVAVVVVA